MTLSGNNALLHQLIIPLEWKIFFDMIELLQQSNPLTSTILYSQQ